MTRRKIYFYDNNEKKLYSTPEFNGDKEEFIKFNKRGDSCDKNFDEILNEFIGIKSKEEFEKASNKAQSYYHSFLGDEILPINEVTTNESEDEIFMINNEGELYLYNPSELTREYLQEVANKGSFIFENHTMKVGKYYSDFCKANIYTLTIEELVNIITQTPQHIRLGAIEDKELTSNLEEFINKEFDHYKKRTDFLRQYNVNVEPKKLSLIRSPNSNFNIAFQDEEGEKYVLDDAKDYFTLIRLDKSRGEPDSDLKHTIEIEGKIINTVYDSWLDTIIYDLEEIDIKGLKMAAKLNSYMTNYEDIFGDTTINKNLNDIFHDIYNEDNIVKYFFEKYKDDKYINELKEEYNEFLNDSEKVLDNEENCEDEIL